MSQTPNRVVIQESPTRVTVTPSQQNRVVIKETPTRVTVQSTGQRILVQQQVVHVRVTVAEQRIRVQQQVVHVRVTAGRQGEAGPIGPMGVGIVMLALAGAKDGSNMTFTLPPDSGASSIIQVLLNGLGSQPFTYSPPLTVHLGDAPLAQDVLEAMCSI